MVTRIHRHRRPRYYLKEHREFNRDGTKRQPPITAAMLGERLGIHEKSVYRTEKETWRIDREEKLDQWAVALGLDSGADLKVPPGSPRRSLDPLVKDASDELYKTIYDVVERLAGAKR